MKRRIALIVIAITTLALAVATVRWADGEFCRVILASKPARTVSRPEWVWALYGPYLRLQHAWVWISLAMTAGAWATIALGGRKGLARPGTVVVTVAFLVACAATAHFLVAVPAISLSNGTSYGLRTALEFRVPGAILGVWAVTRGRKSDWRGWLVGGMWMAGIGMLVAYGILFG